MLHNGYTKKHLRLIKEKNFENLFFNPWQEISHKSNTPEEINQISFDVQHKAGCFEKYF